MKSWVKFRARGRFIAWALLPALLVRALTPVGFMPMHDAQGDLYLAFCPGLGDTMLPPAASDDPHRGHHAMHDHSAAHPSDAAGDAKPASQHHNLCPYALSAGPALAHAVPDLPASASRVAFTSAPGYPSVQLPTIERAQSARAPPAPRIA